ncbi:MAG: hypothetical protein Q7T89_02885 [Anaerolineales bacterium]|nr:hypothetical protein [Anaerolineales bacterium]
MKRSMFVFLSLLAIAALSACAPQGTPTPSVAELQATVMANAQTQISLTAASIPTAMPLPPTPMPTPIPVQPTAIIEQPVVAPPTQPAVLAPAAAIPGVATETSEDECAGPLSEVEGPLAEVTFNNTTDGDLSLYLYSYKTEFGCGVGNVSIAPLESETISVPKGCYDFYGWIDGPKDSTPAGYGCLTFDQTVTVRQNDVIFKDQ